MALSFFAAYAFEQYRQGRFKTEEEAFLFMRKSGITQGDIIDFDFCEYPLYLQYEIMTSSGVFPSCYISTLDVLGMDAKTRKRNIAITKERIDSAAKLDIAEFMIAPFGFTVSSSEEFKQVQNNLIESLAELAEYGKKADVKISIENHSSSWRPDAKMKDVLYILDAVSDVSYIFDTGNFFCIGENAKEAYELLKDKIYKVHLKDWKYDPFGDLERENLPRFKECELGKGEVPLNELFKSLKFDNFNGDIVIETNPSWEEFDHSVKFAKEFL
ncbi:MAG: sugar phosphate isomerase/epimerase [Clostridia bacterium]|nr:sugar phosphate isomerase/epimerase [Clostridia bacterium]